MNLRNSFQRLLVKRILGIPDIDKVYKGFQPADLLVLNMGSINSRLSNALIKYKLKHNSFRYYFYSQGWTYEMKIAGWELNNNPVFTYENLNVFICREDNEHYWWFLTQANRSFEFYHKDGRYELKAQHPTNS